jgi:hypothetical protein
MRGRTGVILRIALLGAAFLAALPIAAAVSWVLALRGPSTARAEAIEGYRDGNTYSALVGHSTGGSWWYVPHGWSDARASAIPLPSWVAVPSGPRIACTTVSGWPLPCLAAHDEDFDFLIVDIFGPHPPTRRDWDSVKWTRNGTDHWFPTLPIWPALLLDAAFYAAVILLAVFGIGRLRRRWRRARGLCVRCGYNRVGLEHEAACPECGATPTI